MKLTKEINPNIFREYDVRGRYPTDINEDFSFTFGKAYGTYIKRFNQKDCVVGFDNRLSSESLVSALIKGILSTGTHVLNIGLVTTPMFYHSLIKNSMTAGIMVTASHNPKDDNGFKFSFDDRGNAKGEMIQEFYKFIMDGNFDDGLGMMSNMSVKDSYYQLLKDSVNINPNRNLRIVIDCANGTTSPYAPEIYSSIIKDTTVLYGESDGNFPNHHPDPCVEENLTVLKKTVLELKADIGIAFDGDGDRIGIVDEKGNYIPTDKMMIIIARHLIPNNTNKRFLYDVKCSKSLPEEIVKLGGEAIISRTGNSYTKANTKKHDCIFGGEYSGHVYFRDKFPGFDSGIYAGLRMLEILSNSDKPLSELLDGINEYSSTPEIKIPSTDELKKTVVENIKQYCLKSGFKIIDIDGVRVEFKDGWALVRYSNTGPNITARFEAQTPEMLDKLQKTFLGLIDNYNK